MKRDSMDFDVVIVGAGPAGLSAAYQLAKLASDNENKLTICVVEKGAEIGAHILSGAVFETKALDELFPNWKKQNAPVNTAVTQDELHFLKNESKHISIPHFFHPPAMSNTGNYIISLGELCRWLAQEAEQLGVEIFPGFPAQSVIIEDNKVKGIITGDMGISAKNEHKPEYTPGMELRAKYTILAEGCRGNLAKTLINYYNLNVGKDPQHYGLGIKELWEIKDSSYSPGKVLHTFGWPLSETKTTGGGFCYHIENNQVSVGLITDLNYQNPHLDPFNEFQRFKTNPLIAQILKNGKRIAYGARAIAKGGLQSLPRMTFPGGLLIGCDAGTLNPAKIKGNHTAMKSGMLAAECIYRALQHGKQGEELVEYTEQFEASWIYQELYQNRNFAPLIHRYGSLIGGAISWLDMKCKHKLLTCTLRDQTPDHACLKPAANYDVITYKKADGILTFDRMSSVFLSNTNHVEDQPCHLHLKDQTIPINKNLPAYNEPAQRYCPAGVYEVVKENGVWRFVINAQNCVHCKSCDIKDPTQNIDWCVPEGGGGPNYPNM